MQAILAGRSSTSKRVMRAAPLRPARRFDQEVSTSPPSGVTMPRPVMTTRLMDPLEADGPRAPASSLSRIGISSGSRLGEEFHGIANGQDGLGRVVWNLAAEFLLESHDQLDRVERIGAEIVDEARVLCHLVGLDPKV